MNYINEENIKEICFNFLEVLDKTNLFSNNYTYNKNYKEQMVKTLYNSLSENEEINNVILNKFCKIKDSIDLGRIIKISIDEVFEKVQNEISNFFKRNMDELYYEDYKHFFIFKVKSRDDFLGKIYSSNHDFEYLVKFLVSYKFDDPNRNYGLKILNDASFLLKCISVSNENINNFMKSIDINDLLLYRLDVNFYNYIDKEIKSLVEKYKDMENILKNDSYYKKEFITKDDIGINQDILKKITDKSQDKKCKVTGYGTI